MKMKFKKLNQNAKKPYKKYDIDAGFDLTATWKKETEKYIEYGTDIAFEIPKGYVGLLFPRSSITKKDLILKNSVGVVDASYRGEIKFRYWKTIFEYNNIKKWDDTLNLLKNSSIKAEKYEIGDRCGQIIFLELPKIELEEVNELSETERGTQGYGSSGK